MSPSDERRDAKRTRTHKKIEIKALPVTGLVPVKKHCHTCMCLCATLMCWCRSFVTPTTHGMGRVNEYWLDMPDGSKESVATAAMTNRKNNVFGNAVELRNELTVKNYLTCLVDVHGTALRAGYAACDSCDPCSQSENAAMLGYILQVASQPAALCQEKVRLGRRLDTLGPDERGVVLLGAHDLYLKTSGPLQVHAVMNPVLLTRPSLLETEFYYSETPEKGRWLGSRYKGEDIVDKWDWALVGGQMWRTKQLSSKWWPQPLAHHFASFSPMNAVHGVPVYKKSISESD